jgi:Cu-processing system permease protein
MSAVLVIAGKEIRDGFRNRWVLAATALLAALALTLALLGSTPTGAVKVSPLVVTVVSLSSLTIFIIPLIALLLSYDAIVGEIDRGTMALLLAYPVSRGQVVIGKFLGHLAILAIATTIGYGAAGLALVAVGGGHDPAAARAFAAMIGSSIMLGSVFIAVGYVVSAVVRERTTAGGIAIGVWLFFVIIYDMALLGILVADQGRFLTAGRLSWALLLNPADAYRLANLAGFSNVAMFSGMAGASAQTHVGLPLLIGVLAGWTVLPLGIAAAIFSRRQL